MSERKSISLRMQGDLFIRKKAVRFISIIDQAIAGILLFFAAYRLVNYDFRDQSFIGARRSVIVAIVYWLGVFALIGLQLVIAFLLLTGIKDMTTDTETMMKKCILWKTFSIILLLFLSLDLLISIYIYFTDENEHSRSENQRLASVILDFCEILFRIIGLYFVSKFITDLSSIFGAPMSNYDEDNDNCSTNNSTTGMHRCSRANSLHRSTSKINPTDYIITPSSPTPSSTVADGLRRTLPMTVGDNRSLHRSPSGSDVESGAAGVTLSSSVKSSTTIKPILVSRNPSAHGPSERLIIRTQSLKAPAGLHRSISTSPTPTPAHNSSGQEPQDKSINRTSSADAFDRVKREKLGMTRRPSIHSKSNPNTSPSRRSSFSASNPGSKVQRIPSVASTGSTASAGSTETNCTKLRRGTICSRNMGGPLIISIDLDDGDEQIPKV